MHIVDGASQWPALRKWTPEYLQVALAHNKLKTRTIKTQIIDETLKDSPSEGFYFDYNDGSPIDEG